MFANLDGAGNIDNLSVVDLPANGYTKWDTDFSDVTDSKTNPATGTAVSMNADFSARWTFTYETDKFVDLSCRQADATHRISIQATAAHLVVYKDDGGLASLGLSAGVFANGIGYQLDAVFEGSSIKVYLDNVLKQDITNAWQQTTTGGVINNNLVTNDIVVTTHPYPALGIATDRVIAPQNNTAMTMTPDAIVYYRGYIVAPVGNVQSMYRYVDADNRILFVINTNGSVSILQYLAGAFSSKASAAAGTVSDDDDVALVLDGVNCSIFVNGTSVAAVTTIGHLTGTVAIVTDVNSTTMDSVEIFPRDVSSILPSELT